MPLRNREELTLKQKKIISAIAFVLFLVFCGLVTWFIGRPMISLVSEPEKFRVWVDSKGIWGRLIFIGMVFFQVVIALIPGEPLEIGAGYAFGAIEGTLLCLAGIALGSLAVLFLVRRFGIRLLEVFFSTKKIKELKFLQNEKKRDLIIFIIFFLPGTPKDLLTYFVGLVDIKPSTFLLLITIARIPSVITSTIGGSALGVEEYKKAIIVFTLTALISALGILIYRKISAKK